MQLGSSPTRGMPRPTSGIKRSRLRRAFSRAASTSPAESIGLPQQTISGRCTWAPAAAKSRTAPTPISGHWYSVQVSLKSATSTGPSPCGGAARETGAPDGVEERGGEGSEGEPPANVAGGLLEKAEALLLAHPVEDL